SPPGDAGETGNPAGAAAGGGGRVRAASPAPFRFGGSDGGLPGHFPGGTPPDSFPVVPAPSGSRPTRSKGPPVPRSPTESGAVEDEEAISPHRSVSLPPPVV